MRSARSVFGLLDIRFPISTYASDIPDRFFDLLRNFYLIGTITQKSSEYPVRIQRPFTNIVISMIQVQTNRLFTSAIKLKYAHLGHLALLSATKQFPSHLRQAFPKRNTSHLLGRSFSAVWRTHRKRNGYPKTASGEPTWLVFHNHYIFLLFSIRFSQEPDR